MGVESRLSRDSAERKALVSLLGTRAGLKHCMQRWVETHRPPPQVEQLKLWGENITEQ